MATATKLLTAEEFFDHPSSRWCELIDGVPIEMSPPGFEATTTAGSVIWLLSAHVRPGGLGHVLTDPGVILRRNPDLVRAPDAAFIRSGRIPVGQMPTGYSDIVPDLIVEVVSPGDRPSEIQTKIREWIEGGARLVWVIYPATKTVQVIRSLQDREVLGVDDRLSGGDVLPGFSCSVAEIFQSSGA
jgi:Uma2 family endonuclease